MMIASHAQAEIKKLAQELYDLDNIRPFWASSNSNYQNLTLNICFFVNANSNLPNFNMCYL